MSLMQSKADTASAVTVSLSGWGLYLHLANKWVAEFMPLITAIGILGGLMVTIWYYRKCISQREKDQEIERQKLLDHMEQREHDLAMARKGHERDS